MDIAEWPFVILGAALALLPLIAAASGPIRVRSVLCHGVQPTEDRTLSSVSQGSIAPQ